MGGRSSKSHSKTTPLTEEEKRKMRVAKRGRWEDRHALLCSAAYEGDRRVVAFLLNKHPQILYGENSEALSALHLAADAGHLDVVSLLLKHPGIDVSKTWDGWTALHTAAAAGHADVVALLLNHASAMLNSNINKGGNRGLTALHLAVLEGHADVVALLLKCPEVDVNERDDRGETALHIACCPLGSLNPNIMRMLLTHPAIDPNVRSPDYGHTPIMQLLLMDDNIDIKRDCLRAMVESNTVDLEVKDARGLGLVPMAW